MGCLPETGDTLRGARGKRIVYATARGSNVVDVDGNRYVDLAAGFGALLLGHGHPSVARVLELQSKRLFHALGDVYPSDAKVGLLERVARLHPEPGAQVIVGQSGSDAVTAALKTACLATGKPGVIAFRGGYHGLGYAPLAATSLRAGYRDPFAAQLNPHVRLVDYPAGDGDSELDQLRGALGGGDVGAVLFEPILGRGGCVVPPPGFMHGLCDLCSEYGAVSIADEVWTGLGRSGALLYSASQGAVFDLICLGKGLGGGLPLSACIGKRSVMAAWRRAPEVVHTSTFAGAPLAAATALATLDTLERERLVERSEKLGERFRSELAEALGGSGAVVRGAGLMIGIDLGPRPGAAFAMQERLLEHGYIATTGGGAREVLVLTPPLTIAESLLAAPELRAAVVGSLPVGS
jgi:4-aminobutyrate aminotransferase/(S)-3-amino-2-methylpropionate transaminase